MSRMGGLLLLVPLVALSAATTSAFAPASPLPTSARSGTTSTRWRRPRAERFQLFSAPEDRRYRHQRHRAERFEVEHQRSSAWSEGVDPNSGRVYWYNEVTGESRWDDEVAGGRGQAVGFGYGYGYMRATYDSPDPDHPDHAGALIFSAGDVIEVMHQGEPGGYWEGALNGQVGWFPSNYCVPLSVDEEQHQRSNRYPLSKVLINAFVVAHLLLLIL